MKTKSDLNIDRINEKNSAIAPGLTIVFWCNDSIELINTINMIRKKISNQINNIWWYSNEHIHATLTPLVRTKYNEHLPLDKLALPNEIFKIIEYISKTEIFKLKITHYSIKKDGQIQLTGSVIEKPESIYNIRRINESIDSNFEYLARPKANITNQIHTNIGYFKYLPKEKLSSFTKELENEIIIEVNKVSVVHYLKRTLEIRYIVSQIHVPLQSELKISRKDFNQLLKIR